MRKLFIIRHAHSEFTSRTQQDIDRPLTGKGNQQAGTMAARLQQLVPETDLLITSDAVRTKETCSYFSKMYPEAPVIETHGLYHAAVNDFYAVITGLKDDYYNAAVFSHNPGITDFVNLLTDARIDNMPPCGIFAVTFEGSWNAFKESEKKFLFFEQP
jgi:phosphohistidine phosphatase